MVLEQVLRCCRSAARPWCDTDPRRSTSSLPETKHCNWSSVRVHVVFLKVSRVSGDTSLKQFLPLHLQPLWTRAFTSSRVVTAGSGALCFRLPGLLAASGSDGGGTGASSKFSSASLGSSRSVAPVAASSDWSSSLVPPSNSSLESPKNVLSSPSHAKESSAE